MAENTCTIDNCDRAIAPHGAKGLCGPHYMRAWRGQDPTTAPDPRPADAWQRFLTMVEVTTHPASYRPDLGPCWLWLGTINRGGYGQLRRADGAHLAHRYAYEHEVGPVPVGLDLDHLCRIRHCANPLHVEPTTRSENLRRGYEARRR